MLYRTKTYIAGDWTGDKNLIDQLYEWNDSNYLLLHFVDAHDLTQARDTSLYCSIKKSLSDRLKASKTFVLVVGGQTASLTKGSCQYCDSYNSWTHSCARGHSCNFRSYIKYECEKAVEQGLRIVVIYNSASIQRSKCPLILQYTGTHVCGQYIGADGARYWNYQAIKDAIMDN